MIPVFHPVRRMSELYPIFQFFETVSAGAIFILALVATVALAIRLFRWLVFGDRQPLDHND